MTRFSQVIHIERSITYFEERDPDIDKVVQIFVRINSGGKALSHSDLLLSIATSQWQERNAREEIYDFVDELNDVHNGFSFSKDFVMKSCLVLGDFDVAFRVGNFNRNNMLEIERKWDSISGALRLAVTLVGEYGYDAKTLTSNNALIPIAYYLNQQKYDFHFLTAAKHGDERAAIKKWLILALLKGAFSGQSDTTLRLIRDAIKEKSVEDGVFPTARINRSLARNQRAILFSEEEIEDLIDYKYGQPQVFGILSLLYPNLDYRNTFHLDHIHPSSNFSSARRLRGLGIPDEAHDDYKEPGGYLGNLQLLEGIANQEKNNKQFQDWINEAYPKKNARDEYVRKNLIPDTDYSFANFVEFFEAREQLMIGALRALLK